MQSSEPRRSSKEIRSKHNCNERKSKGRLQNKQQEGKKPKLRRKEVNRSSQRKLLLRDRQLKNARCSSCRDVLSKKRSKPGLNVREQLKSVERKMTSDRRQSSVKSSNSQLQQSRKRPLQSGQRNNNVERLSAVSSWMPRRLRWPELPPRRLPTNSARQKGVKLPQRKPSYARSKNLRREKGMPS